MGGNVDEIKKSEELGDASKRQGSYDVDGSAKVLLGEKGTSNHKKYASYTNVEKAKDLLRKIKRENQTFDDIKKHGFRFSYDDEDLPTKFKGLFGKDGVMDLLADALMMKDKTSTKVYSFADMRNELKIYYKNLKLETFKTGTGLAEESMKTVVELSKDLEDVLTTYKSEMQKCLKKLSKISKNSQVIDRITKVVKIVSGTISILSTIVAQPEITVVSMVVSSLSAVVSCSKELYVCVKVNSIKKVVKQYQKEINNKYKQIKEEYIKILSNSKDSTNKTLIIEKYDKNSLETFNRKCREVSDKYYVKVSRFKIWSKELNKQKEIFKCGINNLMQKN